MEIWTVTCSHVELRHIPRTAAVHALKGHFNQIPSNMQLTGYYDWKLFISMDFFHLLLVSDIEISVEIMIPAGCCFTWSLIAPFNQVSSLPFLHKTFSNFLFWCWWWRPKFPSCFEICWQWRPQLMIHSGFIFTDHSLSPGDLHRIISIHFPSHLYWICHLFIYISISTSSFQSPQWSRWVFSAFQVYLLWVYWISLWRHVLSACKIISPAPEITSNVQKWSKHLLF